MAAIDEAHWIEEKIEPFRVVFAAVFFVSIGMTLDIAYFLDRWWVALLLAAGAMLTNTSINAFALRFTGIPWSRSLYIYTAAMLGQLGAFSFLPALAGRQSGVITDGGYRLTVAVIFLTLVASPAWIQLFGRLGRAWARSSHRGAA